jgi:ureidoacrylate peracid hydrolase
MGKVITIDAKPAPVAIDLTKTAVIVVDMQNDFGSKGGMLDIKGIPLDGSKKAIAATANVLAMARKAGLKVVYLKGAYLPDLSDLGTEDSTNRARHVAWGVGDAVKAPDGRDSRVLIRDTWNTDIVSELTPTPQDVVLYKTRFSGFYQTELDAILKKSGISQLLFTGLTTSVCVESTVRDAFFRDYRCVVLSDCVHERIATDAPRSNHEATLTLVEMLLGWVAHSEELEAALTSRNAMR